MDKCLSYKSALVKKLAKVMVEDGKKLTYYPDLTRLKVYNPRTEEGDERVTKVILEDGNSSFDTFLLKNLYGIARYPDFNEEEIIIPFTKKQFDNFYDILICDKLLYLQPWAGNARALADYILITNYLIPEDDLLYTITPVRRWLYEYDRPDNQGDILSHLGALITDDECLLPAEVIKFLFDDKLITSNPIYSTAPMLRHFAKVYLESEGVRLEKQRAKIHRFLNMNKLKLNRLGYNVDDLRKKV